ncbi:hypothetical protein Tco_0518525, partial [Tanacetum coccineum]
VLVAQICIPFLCKTQQLKEDAWKILGRKRAGKEQQKESSKK